MSIFVFYLSDTIREFSFTPWILLDVGVSGVIHVVSDFYGLSRSIRSLVSFRSIRRKAIRSRFRKFLVLLMLSWDRSVSRTSFRFYSCCSAEEEIFSEKRFRAAARYRSRNWAIERAPNRAKRAFEFGLFLQFCYFAAAEEKLLTKSIRSVSCHRLRNRAIERATNRASEVWNSCWFQIDAVRLIAAALLACTLHCILQKGQGTKRERSVVASSPFLGWWRSLTGVSCVSIAPYSSCCMRAFHGTLYHSSLAWYFLHWRFSDECAYCDRRHLISRHLSLLALVLNCSVRL